MTIQARNVLDPDTDWGDVVDGDCSDQNSLWWSSAEAIRIARNVLLYQRDIGGWPKNTQMHQVLSQSEKNALLAAKPGNSGCTIDNSAVKLELKYLSKVYKAISNEALKAEIRAGFLKGVQYLLDAQYDNGGWPQFFPLTGGYSDHITYNDNAMVNAMEILRHLYQEDDTYAIVAEDSTLDAARIAFEKGLECILNTQYIQNGVPTIWCAQHHYKTLVPEKARSYELPALWAGESRGIVELLMSIDHPSYEIRRAIFYAAKWYDEARIVGEGFENYTNEDGLSDRRLIYNASASDMWARCYTLENSIPFFCDRDGVKLYTHYDYNIVLSYDRRTGYSWFGGSGRDVLYEYEKWFPRWGAGMDKPTIITSPGSEMVYAEGDTVFIRAFANQDAGVSIRKFQLFLDDELIHVFGSSMIDTSFTEVSRGAHLIIVKSIDDAAHIAMDSCRFFVGAPLSITVTDPVGMGEVSISPPDGPYVEGMQVFIQANPAFQYKFEGWLGDLNITENPARITLDSGISVGAHFVTDTTSTIHINFQPETVDVPKGYVADYGDPYAERKNGNTYGWVGHDHMESVIRIEEEDPRLATHIEMNKTEPVGWEIELPNGNYAVYVHLGDADLSDLNNSLIVESVDVADATPGTSFYDDFYLEDLPVTDGKLTLMPNGANEKLNYIKIGRKGTVFGNYLGVTGGSGSGEYGDGDTIQIVADSIPGQSFGKWTGDVSHVSDPNVRDATVVMSSTDVLLKAVYTQLNYAIDVNAGSGSGAFPLGQIVSIQADTPPIGQEFDRWFGDTDHIVNMYDSTTLVIMPEADIQVTASYKPAFYKLIVKSGDGDGDYHMGDTVSIHALPPSTGRVFDSWTRDTLYIRDVYALTTTVIMPPANIVVSATYRNIETGIKDQAPKNNVLNCYPNPTSSSFSIDLTNIGPSSIAIYNLVGKPVYKSFSMEFIHVIKDYHLSSGIYFVRATDSNNRIYTQKVVIK